MNQYVILLNMNLYQVVSIAHQYGTTPLLIPINPPLIYQIIENDLTGSAWYVAPLICHRRIDGTGDS